MEKVKGVNLGGWLVLEKWMHPALFDGYIAEHYDETSFCRCLSDEAKRARLQVHRDTFITLNDFRWIRDVGLNSVRIPVPHWIFDDCAPYVGCAAYLDRAFDWAEETGLSILIDLHTAPGCQNGFDNGGITGVCDWRKDPANLDRTVMVLEKLCRRYRDRKAMLGIELLNEPSWENPFELVRDFTIRAYKACRAVLKDEQLVVFHDAFRLKAWENILPEKEYPNVVLDTHLYQCFDDGMNALPPEEHARIALTDRKAELTRASQYHRVIVGEWSLGLTENEHWAQLDDTGRMLALRAYCDAQLLSQEECLGWYFWSYKLIRAADDPSSKPGRDGWHYHQLVEAGIMPRW